MPEAARRKAGIFEEQIQPEPVLLPGAIETHNSNEGLYLDLKNGWHRFWPRVPSDEVKEDYMFEQAKEHACNAVSILVLCGSLHVEELARRFKTRGDNSETDALYKYDWYNPDG